MPFAGQPSTGKRQLEQTKTTAKLAGDAGSKTKLKQTLPSTPPKPKRTPKKKKMKEMMMETPAEKGGPPTKEPPGLPRLNAKVMKMRTFHVNDGRLPDGLRVDPNLKESTPLTKAEQDVLKQVEALVPDDLVGTLDDIILTRIIRGYETYEERVKDTADCYQKVAEWRLENKVDQILRERLPRDEAFHDIYPTTFYGHDKYGHILQCEHLARFKLDDLLAEFTTDEMILHRVQMIECINNLKNEVSIDLNIRTYKHDLLYDLTDMSVWGLKKAAGAIQELLKMCQLQYPESAGRIYMINVPMVIYGFYSVIKPFIHPITRDKIQVLKTNKATFERMIENGYSVDQIPEFLGGTHEGTRAVDAILQAIAEVKELNENEVES